MEALCIVSAVKHFAPYVIQSRHQAQVLTDSKPCVQAFQKLARGEFSVSARVSTFLTVASRYHIAIQHLAGSANLPSDFASRNAPACETSHCQVCDFVSDATSATVLKISAESMLSEAYHLPYTSRSAWLQTQSECGDLRRVHAHLKQGTCPSRKITNVRDVKRYLQVATIAKDGLLVVRQADPLTSTRERIIVPCDVLEGLVTALHIKLIHPSCHQLKKVIARYFYAFDLAGCVERVSQACHQCLALSSVPASLTESTTSDPPETVGRSFAADVMKRQKQVIWVLRETVTSYTRACILIDKKMETLRKGLLLLCMDLQPLCGPPATIRVDAAPGFSALANDDGLRQETYPLR